MTPERVAALVARWVRWYTRDLPPPVAGRRVDELDADLHDHIAHERAAGTGERRIALGVAARMVRGLAADASWRGQTLARTANKGTQMRTPAHRSAVRAGVATAGILLVLLVWSLLSDEMTWSAGDFVFAGVLLGGTGFLLDLALRTRHNLGHRIAAAAIGVAAMVLGEADDAPGLVLFGCLLIAGAIALTLRTAQRGP